MDKKIIRDNIIKSLKNALNINEKDDIIICAVDTIDEIIENHNGDSLSKVEFVMNLENEFNIIIDNEDSDKWQDIDDIIDFIYLKINSISLDFNAIKLKAMEEFDLDVKEFYETLNEDKKYNNLCQALMKIRAVDRDKRNIIKDIFFGLNHMYLSTFGSYFNGIFNKSNYLNLPSDLSNIIDFINYNITDDGCFILYKVIIHDKYFNKNIICYFIDTSDNSHKQNKTNIINYYFINQNFTFKKDNYEIIDMKIGDFNYDIDKFVQFVNILCDNNSYEDNHLKEEIIDKIISFKTINIDEE